MSLIVFIFLFTINFCTTTNTLTQKDEYWAMYEKWLGEHNKTNNLEEKQRRFHNFQATVRRIDYHNSNNESSGYKLGLNQFADLSEKEYEANILCSGLKDFTTVNSVPDDPTDNPSAVNLPNSIDWRKLNAISPIKNQGECGSCWAFSSVSSVESLTFLVTGRLTQLSEQELVDCDTYSSGCGGGNAWKGLGFILRNGGINSAEAYPYTGVTGNCNEAKKNVKVASIVGFRWVAQNNTNALMNAVAFQPAVSVVVDATGSHFRDYRSGIFSGPCGKKLSHVVNIVGYGTEHGTDYWIVRNSWGPHWGEQGYIRIRRNVADQSGVCGIAMFPVYPIKSLII